MTTADRAILAVCPSGSRTIQYAGVPLSRSSLVPALTSQLRSPVARRSHVVGGVTKTLERRGGQPAGRQLPQRDPAGIAARVEPRRLPGHDDVCPGSGHREHAHSITQHELRVGATVERSALRQGHAGQPAPDAHRFQQSGCIHRPRRGRAVPEGRHRHRDRRGAHADGRLRGSGGRATTGGAVVAGSVAMPTLVPSGTGSSASDQSCQDEPKRWRPCARVVRPRVNDHSPVGARTLAGARRARLVADGGGLENRYGGDSHRGFESHALRR